MEITGIFVGGIGGKIGGGGPVEVPSIPKPGGNGGAVFIIGGGRRLNGLEGISPFGRYGGKIGGGGGPFGPGLFGNLSEFEGGGCISEG